MKIAALFAPAVVVAIASCSGEPSLSGAGEPILVQGATFIQGTLPGTPPPPDGGAVSPDVTLVTSANNAFIQGQAGVSFGGDVTDDATSLAVSLADAGTGYWVFAPGGPDPTEPGDLTWSMTCAIGANAPPGLGTLLFAAVDANGNSGTQFQQPVCIDTAVPDNFNACAPTDAPPDTVISLTWDTPVALDLQLVTPAGVTVSPTHPTTAISPDAGTTNLGVLDRNSDANCTTADVYREDIVWKKGTTPDPGTYLAYANLFSACGKPIVHFTLSLYVSETTDGGYALVEKSQTSGQILAVDENGGGSLGLYVQSFTFPLSP